MLSESVVLWAVLQHIVLLESQFWVPVARGPFSDPVPPLSLSLPLKLSSLSFWNKAKECIYKHTNIYKVFFNFIFYMLWTWLHRRKCHWRQHSAISYYTTGFFYHYLLTPSTKRLCLSKAIMAQELGAKGRTRLVLGVDGKNGMELCAMRNEASGKVQWCFVQWENSVVALTTSCIRNDDNYLMFLILHSTMNGCHSFNL